MVTHELTLKRVSKVMLGQDEHRWRLGERQSYDSYRPSHRRDSSPDIGSSPLVPGSRLSRGSALRDHPTHLRQNETLTRLKSPDMLKDRLTRTSASCSPIQQSACYSPPSPSRPEDPKSSIDPGSQHKLVSSPACDKVIVLSALPPVPSSLTAGLSTERSEYLGSSAIKRPHDREDSEPIIQRLRTESDSDPDKARMNGSRRLCKNYNCLGEHGYQDCPLPKICWGCRSTNHYWSYCPMTCTKCQAERHSTKYCDDFEVNSTGKSQPKAPPPETIDNTYKGNRPEHGNVLHATPAPDSEMQQHASSLVHPFKEEPKSSPVMEPAVLSNGPADETIQNTSSQERAADFLAGLDELTHIPKGPAKSSGQENGPPYPPNTGMYDDTGEKIYCSQWLKWGGCAYYFTSHGCIFKHEIPPDERTQKHIGLSLASPWLKGAPFAGQSLRNGRLSTRWSATEPILFERESRSYQEPTTYRAAHDLWRPRGGERGNRPDGASEDRYIGVRDKSRLYSKTTRESSTRVSQPLETPDPLPKSSSSQSPIKKREIASSTRSTAGEAGQRAARAESTAARSQAEVVRLGSNNAASYKVEQARKIAKADLAVAEQARLLANKEAIKASIRSEEPEKTKSSTAKSRGSSRFSQAPAKVTTATEEMRRGSRTLSNTAYPTPTSQKHEEHSPKATSKASLSLSALPTPNGTSAGAQNSATEDPMTAMLKAFEDEQAEEQRKHEAVMAAKASQQKQELASHLKRKGYDAKRKREEEERKMDDEHQANIKKLRGN